MVDWPFWSFAVEVLVAVIGAPIMYLTWASGYLNYLWRAAARNHWGRDLPPFSKKKSGAETWEDEISRGL